MPVDAIVRVSFRSNPAANNAASEALTGDPSPKLGTGAPLQRVSRGAFPC